jgi:hypothetical protein
MREFFSRCGRFRASVCLLASGALPERETAEVATHLNACAACREYHAEIKSVTAALTGWDKDYSHIVPDQFVQARWAKDFERGIARGRRGRPSFVPLFLDWCRDLIWPCRRMWTGFAAVWLLITAINLSNHGDTESVDFKSTRPSPAMVRALMESEGFLAESAKPRKSDATEPSKQPLPAPRTSRRMDFSPI